MQSPLSPPVPYSDFQSDFQFSFDPRLFPQPPQLPPSAELFSPSETDELFNFLDGFDGNIWGLDPDKLDQNSLGSTPQLPQHAPYSNPHLNTVPDPNPASSSSRPKRSTRSSVARSTRPAARSTSKSSSHTSSSSSTTPPANEPLSPTLHSPSTPTQSQSSNASVRSKPLLSTPQKRLNHIMSEQKRRNAIRDGYAQLIALLAPPNASSAALGMPTRGRPKGSGTRGKTGKKSGQEGEGAKGKSGVLFRAVEYCRWLEEGRDALRKEVARVEAAAGFIPS
ncbi:hypothetical protein GYMLUDRAFT_32593 [Collybiopsis luxurians FD-317 M1]|nr:hypothetical protein GYMLUDRAFT_32593 [Collybiopsis luxurians FD-317 M1]